MSNTPSQVRVEMSLSNGTHHVLRFDTCEEAWMWERETRTKHANRRAKADRLSVQWAFYVGCTCFGNVYGGMLHGDARRVDLEWEKALELVRAKKQPDWVGPTKESMVWG